MHHAGYEKRIDAILSLKTNMDRVDWEFRENRPRVYVVCCLSLSVSISVSLICL
jgi:hypothetical protein